MNLFDRFIRKTWNKAHPVPRWVVKEKINTLEDFKNSIDHLKKSADNSHRHGMLTNSEFLLVIKAYDDTLQHLTVSIQEYESLLK